MQSTWTQWFIGILLWSIIMLLPVLITYFHKINPMISTLLLTTFYPVAVAFMTRNGYFWISTNIILAAASIALTMSLILIYAIKTTDTNIVTFVPMAAFILTLGILSTQMNMYNKNAMN